MDSYGKLIKIINEFMNTEKTENKKENTEVENLWKNFKIYFWIIFVVKLVATYGLVKNESWTNFIFYSLDLEEIHLVIINLLIQFIPIILMVALMGYYAYKISGERLKMLKGLWGLLWFGIVLIFIGYYSIKKERDKKLKD